MILDELAKQPTIRVNLLAEKLDVTSETIRRDLEYLTQQGVIDRTYGGAILRQQGEPTFSQRQKDLTRERDLIARTAISKLKDARTLMIGSGATTTQVAKHIAFELKNLTVFVHSFAAAIALAYNPTIRTILIPGDYHGGEGATHGAQAVRFLQDYSAEWAILGASGLGPEGPSDVLIDAAEIYATMLGQSEKCMIVADHSKFNRRATARWAEWEEVDCLLTDKAPSGPLARAVARTNVEVFVAKT